MYIMNHFNNEVATAAYSIEDFNNDMASKRRNDYQNNFMLGSIILFGIVGLFMSMG